MTPRLRTAFITQWFTPEMEGIPFWIADALRDQGLNVVVTTGIPHYPASKPLQGYKAWRRCQETLAGFSVHRAPLYPYHGPSAVRRFANYSSFAMSATISERRITASADVALVYSSPATASLPALWARTFHSTPYVLMVQDVWPDSVFASGFIGSGAARSVAEIAINEYVNVSYKCAAHVVAISPGMRDLLVSRGVPEDKVSVVYNWVDEAIVRPMEPTGRLRAELSIPDDAFVLLYAGNMGPAQALGSWVEAMSRLREYRDLHLVFMGSGQVEPQLRRQTNAMGLANVHFHETVPVAEAAILSADADVLVISLADQPLFRITVPSKVQSILASGKAAIVSAPGEAAALIEESGAGIAVPPEDPACIAAGILRMMAEGRGSVAARGRLGLRFYRSNMSRAAGGAKLAGVLRSAASRGRNERRSRPRLGSVKADVPHVCRVISRRLQVWSVLGVEERAQ